MNIADLKDLEDQELNFNYPLPIKFYQIFSDVNVVKRDIYIRLLASLILFVLFVVFWRDNVLFLITIPLFLCLPIFWFYFCVFRKMDLKENTPMLIFNINDNAIQLYDNYGKLLIDEKKQIIKKADLINLWAFIGCLFVSKIKAIGIFCLTVKPAIIMLK